jgi:hypothetical protein
MGSSPVKCKDNEVEKKWDKNSPRIMDDVTHLKFSMTGQEKGDFLIQITA